MNELLTDTANSKREVTFSFRPPHFFNKITLDCENEIIFTEKDLKAVELGNLVVDESKDQESKQEEANSSCESTDD